VPGVIVIVAVLPPAFLIDIDDGLAVSVQPPAPVPLIGGPAAPELGSTVQSAELLCTALPVTTAVDETSDVPFTVAKLTVGNVSTSLFTVTSPASETATHDCSPPLFCAVNQTVHDWVLPRQLKFKLGKGVLTIDTPDSNGMVWVETPEPKSMVTT
jgi:hypothetical protein